MWFFCSQEGFTTGRPIVFLPLYSGGQRFQFADFKFRGFRSNLFSGLKVGKKKLKVSHFQYVDVAILFVDADMNGIDNLKKVIHCFQLVSGLRVNCRKKSSFSVLELVKKKGYMLRLLTVWKEFPASYLGILLGGNPQSQEFANWCFKEKLATWKNGLLLGGRTALTQATMTNIPIHHLPILLRPF